MKRFFRHLAVLIALPALIFAACPAPARASDATVPGAAPKAEKPLKIQGDAVEYFYEKNRAKGEGNITIDYEGWVLTADSVEVDLWISERLKNRV